jgi:hypothetical protein
MPFVQVDARYEKVREGGVVIDQAVLTAIGIDPQGHRHILGVSVERSEAEVHSKACGEALSSANKERLSEGNKKVARRAVARRRRQQSRSPATDCGKRRRCDRRKSVSRREKQRSQSGCDRRHKAGGREEPASSRSGLDEFEKASFLAPLEEYRVWSSWLQLVLRDESKV